MNSGLGSVRAYAMSVRAYAMSVRAYAMSVRAYAMSVRCVPHRHGTASVCLHRLHSSVPGGGARNQRAENGDPQHQERCSALRGSRNDGEHDI